jgi:TRAP-type C4-dicarboxylate transport system permease small subunit
MKSASKNGPENQPKRLGTKIVRAASKTEAGVWSVTRIMVYISALGLFAMMMVTVADVVGRYAFNRPIRGAYELVGFLLAVAGSWGIAYCQVKKGHIRVDFLLQRFPPKMRAILTSFAYFLGLGAFSLLTWRVILLVQYYLSLKKGNATDTLGIPIFPFVIVLAIGTGAMALVLLFDLIHSLAEVKGK